MGLDPRSPGDAWAAYCFDEACFMWGKHVENRISEATRDAKTNRDAEGKLKLLFERMFKDPDEEKLSDEERDAMPVPRGKFRDPAAMFKKESPKVEAD